jgi:hypothetical protein
MDKIIGNTTATPNPSPDWLQADETKADYIKNKPVLGTLASKDEVVKSDLSVDVQEALDNANSALQSYTETDPTVPAWAKEPTKPSYTASEVGLGNVNNTSDTDKPVSTAQAIAIADAKKAGTDAQAQLNNKADKTVATASTAGLMSAEDKKNLDMLVASAITVLSGTVEPTSDMGEDGDLYLVLEG